MNQEAQQKIVSYFIEEAREHLNTIEQSLLSLQTHIHDAELINELFRAAHSIKGGAAMLGFTSIQRVGHRMEDFFKIFRERSVPVDQHLETLLLRGFDTLSMLLEHVETQTLTDEIGAAALADIEPIFQETETHIYQLLDEIPKPMPEAKPSLAAVMNQQVPVLLKQMVEAVKQPGDVRPTLIGIADRLAGFSQDYVIPGWDGLLGAVKQAIQQGSDLRNVILVVVRTLKQASQDAAQGTPLQISPDLRQLIAPPVAADPKHAALQEMDRVLRSMLDAFKADPGTARSKWQQSLINLRQLGSLHQWAQWVNLVEVIEHVVSDHAQDLGTAVRPILKDLKQAHRHLTTGSLEAIEPSPELLAFMPLPNVTDSFFEDLEGEGSTAASPSVEAYIPPMELGVNSGATAVHRLTDFLSQPSEISSDALEPLVQVQEAEELPFPVADPATAMTDLLTSDWQDPDPGRYEMGGLTEFPLAEETWREVEPGVSQEEDPWSLLPTPNLDPWVAPEGDLLSEGVPLGALEPEAIAEGWEPLPEPELPAESPLDTLSFPEPEVTVAISAGPEAVIHEIDAIIPTPLDLNAEDQTAFENLFQNAEALADIEEQGFEFPTGDEEESLTAEVPAAAADLAGLFGDVMADMGGSLGEEDGMDSFLSQFTFSSAEQEDSAQVTLAERGSLLSEGDSDLGAMFEDLAALAPPSVEEAVDLAPLNFLDLPEAEPADALAFAPEPELDTLDSQWDAAGEVEFTAADLPPLSFVPEELGLDSDLGSEERDPSWLFGDAAAEDLGLDGDLGSEERDPSWLFGDAAAEVDSNPADLPPLDFAAEDLGLDGDLGSDERDPSWLIGDGSAEVEFSAADLPPLDFAAEDLALDGDLGSDEQDPSWLLGNDAAEVEFSAGDLPPLSALTAEQDGENFAALGADGETWGLEGEPQEDGQDGLSLDLGIPLEGDSLDGEPTAEEGMLPADFGFELEPLTLEQDWSTLTLGEENEAEPEASGELSLDELFVSAPGGVNPLAAFTLESDPELEATPEWTGSLDFEPTLDSEAGDLVGVGDLGHLFDGLDEHDALSDRVEVSSPAEVGGEEDDILALQDLFEADPETGETGDPTFEDLFGDSADQPAAEAADDNSLESLGSLFDTFDHDEAPESLRDGLAAERSGERVPTLVESEEEPIDLDGDLGSLTPPTSEEDDFLITDFSHLFGEEAAEEPISDQMQEAYDELAADEQQLEALLGAESPTLSESAGFDALDDLFAAPETTDTSSSLSSFDLGFADLGDVEDSRDPGEAATAGDDLVDLNDLFGDAPPPTSAPAHDLDSLDDLFADADDRQAQRQASRSDLDELTDLLANASAPTPQDEWSDLEAELSQPATPMGNSLDDLAALFDEPAPQPVDELDTLFEDIPVTPSVSLEPQAVVPVTPVQRPAAKATARPATTRKPAMSSATMKVEVKHLDFLNNLVGELVVNRNSLGQNQNRLRQFLENLLLRVQQLGELGQRMQDVYDRSLLEIALVSGRQGSRGSGSSLAVSGKGSNQGLEALEMDQFTAFHSLSQEIIELIVRVRESASDIQFVVDEVEQNARQFGQITTQLQEGLNRARMVPFSQIADRLPRAVRELSIKTGKQVNLVVEGRETLIDKAILEELYDPLTHLVNNALVHGIESPEARRKAGKSGEGKITVKTFYQGNQTIIVVADDGGGIPVEKVKKKAIAKGLISANPELDEVYNVLFNPGFSGRDENEIDDLAGRGVGLDVVRRNINELRGTIQVDSTLGKGTTFTIRLPLTLSISKSMLCISDKALIAFPLDGVEEMMDVPKEEIETDEKGRPTVQCAVGRLPFRPLSELLTYNRSHSRARSEVYSMAQDEGIVPIVVIQSGGQYAAIQVDNFVEEQEIVIKQLRGPSAKPLGIAGATVQGNGKVLPIADIIELVDLAYGRIRPKAMWEVDPDVEVVGGERQPTVLIVDDSITVRAMLSMTFTKAGYRVEQARDGQDAWEKLRGGLPCDLVFCDIEMPRMDGLELLSRMRDDTYLKELPIAMLTSRGADKHRQIARERGANAYFTKPYLEEELLTAAQHLMEGEVLLTP